MEPNDLPLVTVFGASGFVGTQVVQALARKGYRIRAAVRRPDLAGHLRMPGAVGQIVPVQANVRNAASVARAVEGAGIAINLAGIGIQGGAQTFEAVNHQGAQLVAQAASAAGARVLVHVSGLGLSAESGSAFARSKAAGEAAVAAAFPQAVIVRPSVIFGPGDDFFTRMGTFARLFPILPLIGENSRMQPVYVGDVAEVIARAAEGTVRDGRIYELGGPEIETNRQLWARVLRETGRNNTLLPVSQGLAHLLALPMGLLPKPPITGDQVTLLGADNLVSEAAIKDKRTLPGLGLTPVSMDTILPTYLWRFRRNGQFEKLPA